MSATPAQEESIDGVRQKGGAACGTNSLVPPSLANPVGLPRNFLLNPMILKNNNSIHTKKCETSSSSSSTTTGILGTTKVKMPKKISVDVGHVSPTHEASGDSNVGPWSGSVGPMTAGARRRMLILGDRDGDDGDRDGGQEKIGGRSSVTAADIAAKDLQKEAGGTDLKDGERSVTCRSPLVTAASCVGPSGNVHNPNKQKQSKNTAAAIGQGEDCLGAEKSDGSRVQLDTETSRTPHTDAHTSMNVERLNVRAVASSSSSSPLTGTSSPNAPSPTPSSSIDPKVSAMLLRQLQPRAVGTPSFVVRRKIPQNDDASENTEIGEDDAMMKAGNDQPPYADSLLEEKTCENSNKDKSAAVGGSEEEKVFTPTTTTTTTCNTNMNSGKVTPSIPLSQLPTISSNKLSSTPFGRGVKGPTVAAISNTIATRASAAGFFALRNDGHHTIPSSAFVSPTSPFSVSGGEGSSLILGVISPPPLTTPQLKKPPSTLALPPSSRQRQHQESNSRLATAESTPSGNRKEQGRDPCLVLPSESFRQLSVWPAGNVRKTTPATAALLNVINQKPGELTKTLLMMEKGTVNRRERSGENERSEKGTRGGEEGHFGATDTDTISQPKMRVAATVVSGGGPLSSLSVHLLAENEASGDTGERRKKNSNLQKLGSDGGEDEDDDDEEEWEISLRCQDAVLERPLPATAATTPPKSSSHGRGSKAANGGLLSGFFSSPPSSRSPYGYGAGGGGVIAKSPAASGVARRQGGMGGGSVGQRPGAVARHEAPTTALLFSTTPSRGHAGGSEEPGSSNRVPVNANVHHPLLPDEESSARALGTPTPTLSNSRSYSHLSMPRPRQTLPPPGLSTTKGGTTIEMLSPSPSSAALFSHFLASGHGEMDFAISKNKNQKNKPHAVEQLEQFLEDASIRLRFEYPAEESLFRDHCVVLTTRPNNLIIQHPFDQHQQRGASPQHSRGLHGTLAPSFHANELPPPSSSLRQQRQKKTMGGGEEVVSTTGGLQRKTTPQKQNEYSLETDGAKARLDFQEEVEDGADFTPSSSHKNNSDPHQKNVTPPPLYAPKPVRMLVARRFDSRGAPIVGKAASVSLLRSSSSSSKSSRKIEAVKAHVGNKEENEKGELPVRAAEEVSWEPQHASLSAGVSEEGKERGRELNETEPKMVKSSSFRKVESKKTFASSTSAAATHISTVANIAAPTASILHDHMWDYLNRRLEFHRHAAELFFTLFDAYRPVLSQILEGYESHLSFVLHHSTAEQRHWKSVSEKLESENDMLMAALKEEQGKRRESDAICDTLRAQVEVLRHAETELKEQKMIFDHEQLMRDRQAEQAELDKATLTRRMMALEGEIAILQKQLAEPGKAIDRLNAQIAAKNGHIQTLSAQNDRLASENAALKRQQAASSSSLFSALPSHNHQYPHGKDGRGNAPRSGEEGESDAEKLVVASRRLQEYSLTNSELKGVIATQNAKIHTMKNQLNQLLEASGGIGSAIVQATTAAAAAIDGQRFLGASGLSLSLGVEAASASSGQKHVNHQHGLVRTPRERAKASQALSVLSSSALTVHESSSEHDQASRRASSVVRALSASSSAVGAGVKRSGSSFPQRKPSAGGSSSSATDTKKNNEKSNKDASKTTTKTNNNTNNMPPTNSVEVPSSRRAVPSSAAGVSKQNSDSNNKKKRVTAGMSMLASPLDPLSSPPSPSNAMNTTATLNSKDDDHLGGTQQKSLVDEDGGIYKRAESQASASQPPPPLGLSTAASLRSPASRGHNRGSQPSFLAAASSSSSPFPSPREGHYENRGATRSSSNIKNTNPNENRVSGGAAEVEEDAYGSVRGLLLPSLNEGEKITADDFDQLASMYTPRPHLVSSDIARAETTAERMTLAISQIAQLKTELSAARARVSELLALRSTKLQGAVDGMSDVFSATCATYHHPFFEDAVLAFKNPAVRWFIGAGDSEEDTPYAYLRAVGRQRNQRFSLGAVKWHIHTFFAQTPLPWRAASGASQSLGYPKGMKSSPPALGYLLQRWFDSRYPKDGPSMCYSFHATLEWFSTSDVDCYMIKAMLDGTLDETTWRRAVLAVSRLRTEMERLQALRIVAADPSARISTAMAVDELLSNGGANADPSASFSGPSSPTSPTNRDQGETPTSRAKTPYSFPVAGSPSRPRRRISATFINENGLPERCLVATPKYVCSEVAVKAIGNVFGLWSHESIGELVRSLENASHAGVSSSAAFGGGGGFGGGQKASTRHGTTGGASHDKNKGNAAVGQHRKSILTPALSLELGVGGGGAGSSNPNISLSSLFDAVNLSGGQMEPYFSSAVRTLWLVESYTYATDVIECLLEKSASAAGRITPQMVVSSIIEADSECPEHAVHETAERVFAHEKPNGFVFLDDEDDEDTAKATTAEERSQSSATPVVGVFSVGRERDAPIHDRYLKFSDISIPLAECVARLRKLGPARYTPRSVYLQQRQLAHNNTAGAASISRQNPSLSMPVAYSASSLSLTSARV